LGSIHELVKMDMTAKKNEQEKLFDELIDVKLLYKNLERKWKKSEKAEFDAESIKEELASLKQRISEIEKSISKFGDSFLDVYDSKLLKPLSETDIFSLRDEIREVRHSLENIGEPL
jgi:predicted  nucleic acid-binding Zn-ribbon protein